MKEKEVSNRKGIKYLESVSSSATLKEQAHRPALECELLSVPAPACQPASFFVL